jgi:hypothetical protein
MIKLAEKINSHNDLLEWLDKQDRAGILEAGKDYFTLECPNDAAVTVDYNFDDPIDEIIDKTIERFENFDADEEFTEVWCQEFAAHNNFRPRQFINMLTADEQFLHEMAYTLRKNNTWKLWFPGKSKKRSPYD